VTASTEKGVGTEEILKPIGHEVRIDIIRICHERTASPIEISKETGRSLSLVSNHVATLKKAGVLELVKSVPRRGALEHYYRSAAPAKISDAEWRRMPKKQRLVVYRTILQALMAESVEAENRGSFDEDDAHLSWVPFEVDERGRADVVEALADALARVEAIKEECKERLGGEGGQEMVAAIMNFERAPKPGQR